MTAAMAELRVSQPFRQCLLDDTEHRLFDRNTKPNMQWESDIQVDNSGLLYQASCINGLTVRYIEPTITMKSDRKWTMMSNGVLNGGLQTGDTVVNYRVSLQYDSDNPQSDMLQLLQQNGLHIEDTIGLMTAAKLSHAAIGELEHEDFSMLVLATAGTSNATRAGRPRESYRGYHAGTINIMLWLDARMSEAAMVNAIITATEAKSAALADLAVKEAANGLIATGTSTDALVLAVSQHGAFSAEHQYAGTATELGSQLAQLVYAAVHCAVRTQRE